MLLDIVIRPRLLVIGAVLAIAMIQASGWMFNMLFNLWFANVTGTFVHIGMMADITFSIMVISTMYYNIITIFTKGVNYLPERVLSWCGGGSGSGLRDEKGGTAKIVAAGAVLSKSQSIVHGGANAITAGVKYGKSKFKGASEEAAGRRGAREQVVEKGRAIA